MIAEKAWLKKHSAAYEYGCAWFDCLQYLQKMCITCIVAVVAPGSYTQMAVGLIVMLLSIAVYAVFKPYLRYRYTPYLSCHATSTRALLIAAHRR